jgi:DNA-binding transcriptional ArsR family regulator
MELTSRPSRCGFATPCHEPAGRVTYNHMVAQQAEREATDQIFAALSDATRRDIVTRVLRDDASVSTLARHYSMSFAAVQKHVAVLERAGLVTKRRHGREQLVSGDVTTIRSAARLLGQYEEIWRGRIGRIEEILAQPTEGDSP